MIPLGLRMNIEPVHSVFASIFTTSNRGSAETLSTVVHAPQLAEGSDGCGVPAHHRAAARGEARRDLRLRSRARLAMTASRCCFDVDCIGAAWRDCFGGT